jgi:hypothetical protein
VGKQEGNNKLRRAALRIRPMFGVWSGARAADVRTEDPLWDELGREEGNAARKEGDTRYWFYWRYCGGKAPVPVLSFLSP